MPPAWLRMSGRHSHLLMVRGFGGEHIAPTSARRPSLPVSPAPLILAAGRRALAAFPDRLGRREWEKVEMFAIGLAFAFAFAALHPAPPDAAAGDRAAAARAPKPARTPAADGTARAPYVGRWTDTDDCSNVTVLDADGSFIAPNGAIGNWDVRGSTLTLWGPGGSISWQVSLNDNRITLTSPDGSQSQSTRC